nr:VOC family protein [Aurantiacibacter suaedae]
MANARIEHVNLTVSNIHRSASLFKDLCGWDKRWQGEAINGGTSMHVGSQDAYLALYSDGGNHSGQPKGRPLNHVGIEVEDLEAAEQVVRFHGLVPFDHADYEPGRRFYFFDWDGIEFEVVCYQ